MLFDFMLFHSHYMKRYVLRHIVLRILLFLLFTYIFTCIFICIFIFILFLFFIFYPFGVYTAVCINHPRRARGFLQAASNYHSACRKYRQQKLAEEAAAADDQPRTIQGVRKERERGR